MKRYVAFFLSILLLATMTACASSSQPITGTEPPTEDTSDSRTPNKETAPLSDTQESNAQKPGLGQNYEELVERFYTLVSAPYEEYDDIPGEMGVLEAARTMVGDALDGIGYAIEDISGDGVPELVVGILPEYGGQVNVVYTLVYGEPQFVFEGWYRSSYIYMGDGHFFYYGSSSATETGQGVFFLTKDGTMLECDSFLFTHAVDDDPADIRVYYNENGSWDPARSKESEMTLEDFGVLDHAWGSLPLTTFFDYGAEQGYYEATAVRAQWAELWLPGPTDYEQFVADDDEYSVDVMFLPRRAVTDFELMRLTIREVYDDGTVSYAPDPVYSMERLTGDCPLMVRMTFPGDMPAWGISYVDESGDGMTHRLTVEVSGEDGSLILRGTY